LLGFRFVNVVVVVLTGLLYFSGLRQANWETRFLVDIYVLKQWFTVETGFLCVSPVILKVASNLLLAK